MSACPRFIAHSPPLSALSCEQIAWFLQQVEDMPALDDAAIRAAIRRYRDDPHSAIQDRNDVLVSCVRFVVQIARRYQRPSVDMMDLVMFGMFGILDGIERFDPSHQARFTTYAAWWVRNRIQRELPRLLTDEIQPIVSNDGLAGDDWDALLHVPHPDGETAYDQVVEQDAASARIQSLFTVLDVRETAIVRARYGVMMPEQPVKDIANEWHITPQRVHQIVQGALRRMRQATG